MAEQAAAAADLAADVAAHHAVILAATRPFDSTAFLGKFDCRYHLSLNIDYKSADTW